MKKETFLKKYGITEAQFNGSEKIEGSIDLSSVTTLPEGYNRNYVYYRTMRETHCRSHMPSWRSKGYLKIVDKGGATVVVPKLANWHEEKEYVHSEILLKDSKASVVVDADYILETK